MTLESGITATIHRITMARHVLYKLDLQSWKVGARNMSDKECPRCKRETMNAFQFMNCLSRRDNKTYVCNDCGKSEALIDHIGFDKVSPDHQSIEINFMATLGRDAVQYHKDVREWNTQ